MAGFLVLLFRLRMQRFSSKNALQPVMCLNDGRSISPAQRRKIFALINDIASYTSGFDPRRAAYDETLKAMQLSYLIDITDCEQVRRGSDVSLLLFERY